MPTATHTVTVTPAAGGAAVDISSLVEQVTIHHGRDDDSGQPEASSATVDLLRVSPALIPPELDIGAALQVTTTTPAVSSQRFGGRVTDMSLGWKEEGEDTPDWGAGQVVAVGHLADPGRRVVGDAPFPQELDGARVSRVLALAGITLDPLTSDPGTVQILARDIDSQPALNVAQDAAQGASGMVWQTRAGEVRYADALHRRGIASSLSLDASQLMVTPTWRRSIEGLVNDVSVGYGATPSGGEQPRYLADEPGSKAKWGEYGYSITTALAALADAQALGQLLLVRNSKPAWSMAALPVAVDVLDQPTYEALLGLELHSLVTITGMPAISTAPTSATLWVEGWRETLGWGVHELELAVSAYCRTVPPPRWNDVDPGWLWGGQQWTEQRRNVIADPRIVTATGWTAVGPGGVLTATSGYTPNQPAAAGERWSVGLDFIAPAGVTLTGTLAVRPTTGGLFGSNPYAATNISVPPGQTLRFVNSYTLPPGADGLRLAWVVSDATARIGRAHAERAATPEPYFDGGSTDYPGADFAWTGVPAASASTLTGRKELRRNLIPNPNFERDVSGWVAYTGLAVPVLSNANPYSGTGRLRADGNGTSGAPRVSSNPALLGMIAGDIYTLSARLRHDGTWPGGGTAYLALRFQLAPSSETVVASTPAFVPDGTGYMRVSVTGTVPAATNGQLVINAGFAGLASSLTAAGSIGVDEVLLERAPAPAGTYFDGDMPDTAALDYAWTGAPGASPSVLSDVAITAGGLPADLTWDDASCLGPPANLGRWDDVAASTRWDQLAPDLVWDNYGG